MHEVFCGLLWKIYQFHALRGDVSIPLDHNIIAVVDSLAQTSRRAPRVHFSNFLAHFKKHPTLPHSSPFLTCYFAQQRLYALPLTASSSSLRIHPAVNAVSFAGTVDDPLIGTDRKSVV